VNLLIPAHPSPDAKMPSSRNILHVVLSSPTLGQIKRLVPLSSLTLAVRLATGIPQRHQVAPHQSSGTDQLKQPGTELSFLKR